VTDAGLECLAELRELQVLDLEGTRVTDAGLAHLAGLKGLRKLDLRGTRVTDAGVADLARALPAARVRRRRPWWRIWRR